MANRKQSRGSCTYCGYEGTKASMAKHLSSCQKRQEAISNAESKKGNEENLIHLRVQDRYAKEFWLDLEARGSASLKDLDHYLRGIWLECCGHLSQFGDWGEEIGMSRKIGSIFRPGFETVHFYDFGTTSETLIKYAGERQGVPTTKYPIALMARNQLPEDKCIKCDKRAEWLCTQCMYESNVYGTLCDDHAETHPHDDYGDPLHLVNSPRTGACGYEGPAEPPY